MSVDRLAAAELINGWTKIPIWPSYWKQLSATVPCYLWAAIRWAWRPPNPTAPHCRYPVCFIPDVKIQLKFKHQPRVSPDDCIPLHQNPSSCLTQIQPWQTHRPLPAHPCSATCLGSLTGMVMSPRVLFSQPNTSVLLLLDINHSMLPRVRRGKIGVQSR